MDPVAHTLVGASLAKTRLGRLTPLATVTLLLAANAPDIDAIAMFLDRETSLHVRRGWTHGILAIAVLPVIITGLMVGLDRLRYIILKRNAEPVALKPLLLLSYLGVLSHPMLDWLNTYGIRLLMPFDDRWFYGDALFIVDPWIWLLASSAVVLAHTRATTSITLWIVAAGASSSLILTNDVTPIEAKLFWCLGLGCLVGLRIWGGLQARISQVAIKSLLAIFVYISSMALGSQVAKTQVRQWLHAEGIPLNKIMAGPVPANPFVRDVVVQGPHRYYFLQVNWLAADQIRPTSPSIAIGDKSPVVQAALRAPHIQGTRHWMRFPTYQIEQTTSGYEVIISDARYSRRPGGLGTIRVALDHQLNVQ